MYLQHFGLRDRPFAITPDPEYLYLSPQHQEALAHLLYGIHQDGGFVLLTGEVGTGKTTLIRSLLAQRLDDVELALCLNPKLTEHEFVAALCDELNIASGDAGTLKPLIDALNRRLLDNHARGVRTVLIIDEAQNLGVDVLEQVRLLTNLETHRHKLLRIVLVGQPELARRLAQPALRQLAQRITARYHLTPLDRADTASYVRHRLETAGGPPGLFSRAALAALCRHGRGIPRLINVVCDRALLGAYVRDRYRVGRTLVDRAAAEVLDPTWTPVRRRRSPPALGLGLAVLLAGFWPLALNPLQPDTPRATGPGLSSSSSNSPASSTPSSPAERNADGLAAKPAAVFPPPLVAAGSALASLERLLAEPAADEDFRPVSVAEKTSAGAMAAPAAGAEPVGKTGTESGRAVAGKTAKVIVTEVDLAQQMARNDSAQSAAALLELWRIDDPGQPADTGGTFGCADFRQTPLRCLAGRADWARLRAYNRPVLITLNGPAGRPAQTLLRSLDERLAVLWIDGAAVPVPLQRLDPVWTGEFVLLWRAPLRERLIGPGSTGEPVDWLQRRLALAERRPVASGDRFDTELQDRVRRFQRSRRLKDDGLVGSRTMLLLNNLAPSPDTPSLDDFTLDRV